MTTTLALLLSAVLSAGAGQTRWHEYTAAFKTPKHPVEVKLASFVGSDKYRLVSDSSVRSIYFNDAGRMQIVGWSDGGNTTDLQENFP